MRLSIPTPCHEDWSAMTPAAQGRHCAACAKTVVDFTTMSDAEVVRHLRQSSGRVCGRVKPRQLDRSLQGPPLLAASLTQPLRAGVASAALAAGLATAAAAQTQPTRPVIMGRIAAPTAVEHVVDTVPEILGELAPVHLPEATPDSTVQAGTTGEPTAYTGTVVDEDDGEPLIGASVAFYRVAGDEQTFLAGCVTDFDGRYSCALDEDADLMEVSYVGYEAISREAPAREGEVRMASGELAGFIGIIVYRRPLLHRLTGWRGGYRIANAVRGIGKAVRTALTAPADARPDEDDPAIAVAERTMPRDTTVASAAAPALTLAPNPTSRESVLGFAPSEAARLLNVYAPSGLLVRSLPLAADAQTHTLTADEHWAAGTYLVELLDAEGRRLEATQWVVTGRR